MQAPDDAGRRRKLVLITIAGIIAAIVAIYLITHLGSEDAGGPPVDARQAVTAIEVQPHSFNPIVSLNGEARPRRDIQVYAPASGVRILQLLVDEGDTVRLGQPMARLDAALSQAQTSAAQASVAEAQSASVRARSEYERAESIRDSGALSTEVIEQRRAAALAADARLAAARAQLAEVNARLGGGFIRAPAAGLVIDRTAQLGAPVEGQALFRIAADNALEVSAQLAEADALALRVGQPATFQLVDGSSVEGRLRRGPSSIDSRTRTGEALFDLPSGTNVRAGMFLRGVATLAPRDVLAISQSSIFYDAGAAFVYVIDDGNVAHKTPVSLGLREGESVEVLSGLDSGQRIVGSGAAFLQDGDSVRPLAPATQRIPLPAAEPAAEPDLRGREG